MVAPTRGDICLVALDPTIGNEIAKIRPCLIVTPPEMLASRLRTTLVVPLTSHGFAAPTRVACRFQERDGFLLLDQLRSVDKSRLTHRLGLLDELTLKQTLRALRTMFMP